MEPFFGSGAVLFSKKRSNIETVNDLDGDVVNFFEWVRKGPERLAREIYLTPYSRQVYENTKQDNPETSLERAVRFCIAANMSHGFKINERSGWKMDVQGREKAYAASWWCNMPEKIINAAERLRGVQIENKNGVDLIRAFNSPKVLVYCDPPYILSTRYKRMYQCEMEDREHEELLDAVLHHKGPVIISGYDSPMYQSMLQGWHKESTKAYNQLAQERTEVIWMNFEHQGHQIDIEEVMTWKQ